MAATGGGRDEGGGMLRSSAAGVGRWGAVEEGNVSAKSFRVVCVYVNKRRHSDGVSINFISYSFSKYIYIKIHLFLTRFGFEKLYLASSKFNLS